MNFTVTAASRITELKSKSTLIVRVAGESVPHSRTHCSSNHHFSPPYTTVESNEVDQL